MGMGGPQPQYRTDIMKGTRNTTARRNQRREAREQRVRAGAPSVRHDWRCPLCMQWYSKYRGRDVVHLRHCKKNHAVQAALEEGKRVRTPLPSPDHFTPRSTPDSISAYQPGASGAPRSPGTRESSVAEDAEWDQQLWDDDPQHLEEDLHEPPEMSASGDEDGPGKPGVVSNC